MTTIVALETKEGVTFASDSRVSGWTINDGWVSKVVRNGPITLGAAGHLRAIQVLQYAKLAPPPSSALPEAVDRYVSEELIPTIVDAFRKVDGDEARRKSLILLAVSGRVYQISGDGAWVRSANGCYAIGSGGEIALGALSAGASPTDAIRIAARYDSGTNADVRELKVNKNGLTRRP